MKYILLLSCLFLFGCSADYTPTVIQELDTYHYGECSVSGYLVLNNWYIMEPELQPVIDKYLEDGKITSAEWDLIYEVRENLQLDVTNQQKKILRESLLEKAKK